MSLTKRCAGSERSFALRSRSPASNRKRVVRRWGFAAPLLLVLLAVGGCVADPPPLIGTAVASDAGAVVSWQPPLAFPAPITAYMVTPWIGQVAQTPIQFN